MKHCKNYGRDGSSQTINRTKLELKLAFIALLAAFFTAINRTKLELKLIDFAGCNQVAGSINRTKLELKQNNR